MNETCLTGMQDHREVSLPPAVSDLSQETPVLSCTALGKTFRQGNEILTVLSNIHLTIQRGEQLSIIGASGSGKSTLLHLLGGLDTPSTGQVALQGKNFSDLSDRTRGLLRNSALGFVYQFHHLLPEFTALENVAMPLLIRRISRTEATERARAMLKEVGLEHRLQHTPAELSGGERQRAAIARALVTQPLCILADEPTGNLDRRSAEVVFELMQSLNERFGTSLVIVTHDENMARRTRRILTLQDGVLQD